MLDGLDKVESVLFRSLVARLPLVFLSQVAIEDSSCADGVGSRRGMYLSTLEEKKGPKKGE
jgi:hypothetical protein